MLPGKRHIPVESQGWQAGPDSRYIGGTTCGSGGTGRRARLRILWPKGRGGSNPSFRTTFLIQFSSGWLFVGRFAVFGARFLETGRPINSWASGFGTFLDARFATLDYPFYRFIEDHRELFGTKSRKCLS